MFNVNPEGSGMEFGWRETAELVGVFWVAVVTWLVKRFIQRQDDHEKRLRTVEQSTNEIKQGVVANRASIEGLRVETRENTRQIIQTIRDSSK